MKILEPIYKKRDGTYVMMHPATGKMNCWCGFPDDPNGFHAEVEAYLAEHPEALVDEPVPPDPTAEQKAAAIVSQRDTLLHTNVDCYNAARWETMDEWEKQKVRDYRQALCDVTDQATFPDSVEWPTKP